MIPPRTNRRSAKRKGGEKKEMKTENSECFGVWSNGREKKEERRIKKKRVRVRVWRRKKEREKKRKKEE